ncbi:MAG TPA: DUF342 domain-containing protein [Campylobacterales bacterium]|nr:DUF342 domain-containing protein [Campylobacterales bacterium]
MSLFGMLNKRKKEDIAPIEFEKKVIESSDIAKDLEEIACAHHIEVRTLDYKIISYKTYYKKIGSPRYRELKEIDREKFFKKENILNPELEILQKLKVEVYKRNSSRFPIKIVIGGNKSLTKVVATIKMQEKVNYFDGLEREILSEIDKKKAKLKILLGCFDGDLRSEIKKLVSSIRVNKKIEKNVTIVLCQAYEMKKHTVGEIFYKFREKEEDSGQRVDHSNKGFMHTIKEGDVIIEVLQPKEGSVGRDCRGNLIALKEVELSNEIPEIKASEDIECKELEDKIVYIANRSGFINETKPNEFEISDEMIVNEVSFRTTGSIEAGSDKDIKIDIKCNDSMSDAIGAGVHIETSEVKAEGNVGNGAVVKAKVIEIGGQTHQSAKLYGGDVSVNLHKGFVDGENITIDLLDGGKVVGDVVRIKKASGGEIEAREVYIETVLSNVTVYASHYIELNKVEGTGNKFIIDAKAQRGFKEKVETIKAGISAVKSNMEKITKKIKQIKAKIYNEKETTIKIHERIIELRAGGTKPPASLVTKMRENQNRIKEHNLLLKELKDARMENETLAEDLTNLQSSVFDAKVINNSTWREFNEVIFRIIEPPISASHLLKDGEIAHEITLKAAEDGEFILNRKG